MMFGAHRVNLFSLSLYVWLVITAYDTEVTSFNIPSPTQIHHTQKILSTRLYSTQQDGRKASSPSSNGTSKKQSDIVLSKRISDMSNIEINSFSSKVQAQDEYQKGLYTIGLITLIFSSLSPAIHAALTDSNSPPPVLLFNALVSLIALFGLVFAGPLLGGEDAKNDKNINNDSSSSSSPSKQTLQACFELGLWKFLGTTANLYGLSFTTADHGAFLIQLTTLIVPVVQGIQGVPIPRRIQFSLVLALCGVWLFTQDPNAGQCAANTAATAAIDTSMDATTTSTATAMAIDAAIMEQQSSSTSLKDNLAIGDLLCVVAAGFYATYDLRLFKWGKVVKPRELITGKIFTQALLSMCLLLGFGLTETQDYVQEMHLFDILSSSSSIPEENLSQLLKISVLALWSGLAVNAIAPYLQVGAQQAVGATRAQTLYASQPLWASILSFIFLGETVGIQGVVGGVAFLSALFLAATAEPPEEDCGVENCEV